MEDKIMLTKITSKQENLLFKMLLMFPRTVTIRLWENIRNKYNVKFFVELTKEQYIEILEELMPVLKKHSEGKLKIE